VGQQRELCGGQLDLTVVDVYPPPVHVHADRPHRQLLLAVRCAACAAQHGADPGDQLAGAERFGDVVVGTQLEADDPVDLVVARRHEQHRSPVVGGTHPTADLHAVHPGQADVEDDRDGAQPTDGVEYGRPIGLDLDPEALPA
jgi:hypothetical protein